MKNKQSYHTTQKVDCSHHNFMKIAYTVRPCSFGPLCLIK